MSYGWLKRMFSKTIDGTVSAINTELARDVVGLEVMDSNGIPHYCAMPAQSSPKINLRDSIKVRVSKTYVLASQPIGYNAHSVTKWNPPPTIAYFKIMEINPSP